MQKDNRSCSREGGEANEVITFTQLTYLKLDYLTNLSSFCSGSYSFMFLSLEEVIVRQCPEMKSFSCGAIRTPMLERVQATQEDEWHWKANLNTTIHWLCENNLKYHHGIVLSRKGKYIIQQIS